MADFEQRTAVRECPNPDCDAIYDVVIESSPIADDTPAFHCEKCRVLIKAAERRTCTESFYTLRND